MSGCGRVTREGLEPTLKSSLPYMERKEKQRKFKLGTQQTILNRDNWTSLRYSKVKIVIFMKEKTYLLIQSFAESDFERSCQFHPRYHSNFPRDRS